MRRQLATIVTALALEFGHAATLPATTRDTVAQFFDIPSQPVASALLEFAHEVPAELVLPTTPFEGLHSVPVRGTYTPDAALARLLHCSAFEGRTEEGVIRIRRHPPAFVDAAGRPLPDAGCGSRHQTLVS